MSVPEHATSHRVFDCSVHVARAVLVGQTSVYVTPNCIDNSINFRSRRFPGTKCCPLACSWVPFFWSIDSRQIGSNLGRRDFFLALSVYPYQSGNPSPNPRPEPIQKVRIFIFFFSNVFPRWTIWMSRMRYATRSLLMHASCIERDKHTVAHWRSTRRGYSKVIRFGSITLPLIAEYRGPKARRLHS
jgi:hypothetical protein